MSDWWQKPYPGGPMVAVLGFPRPLELGDPDGPDVEAYKRTISRAGRWPWRPYDQAFTRAFSLGEQGGNVGESGVAGVQRQANQVSHGEIDQQTFNLLRSIRIPQGLPNAGQAAMDARSVELINAAWNRFHGKPIPEPLAGSAAQARLTLAQQEIGTKESPANSNQCKYTDWYGMVGPWCAMFVTWADQESDPPAPSFEQGSRWAYVPYVVDDARNGRNGLTITSSPEPGDLVCYDWGWDGEYDHIGIVETRPDQDGDFTAIEGNTSASDNSNGGEVQRRNRNRYAQGTVFVRVEEP